MNRPTMTDDQLAVLDIIARHVPCTPADVDAACRLSDLGIDSLKFIMVILDIEQRLQRPIFSLDNVGRLHTVGDILMQASTAKAKGT
jgi:acyl carrier protein